jgi:hypothetical protein
MGLRMKETSDLREGLERVLGRSEGVRLGPGSSVTGLRRRRARLAVGWEELEMTELGSEYMEVTSRFECPGVRDTAKSLGGR